jgi:hypothetical protein
VVKWIRWLLCKLFIRCDIEEKWWPERTAGISGGTALLYECKTRVGADGEREVQYYQCRICKSIMAPFEVRERGWA